MKPSTANRLDFLSGLLLTALGVAIVVESLRMPRLVERDINPYTVPGLVPGILGAVLLLLALVLLIRSVQRGGWRFGSVADDPGGQGLSLGMRRLALALVLTFGYAAGLIGTIPFWAATFVFVLGFIVLFEWAPNELPGLRMRKIGTAIVQAALVSAAVTIVFQELFFVRLP